MAQRVSRRKMADYAADAIVSGQPLKVVLQQLAAYLVTANRTREQELLVRDIETALAMRGLVVADVTSARSLTATLEQDIKKMTGASQVQLRERHDPSVLGGVRIDVAGKRFDGTLRHKLNALKAQQL